MIPTGNRTPSKRIGLAAAGPREGENAGIQRLRGNRKSREGVEYRHAERINAKFWHSFSLPETVKHDGIDASYKDGVLEIHVPKAEQPKLRQIEVTVH